MNEGWQERVTEKEEAVIRMGGRRQGGLTNGGKGWMNEKKGSVEAIGRK